MRDDRRQHVLEMLLRAFFEDPLYRWLFPDPARRVEALRETFALMLDHGLTVHLDSSNRANLTFYERRGFGVDATIEIPGGPTMFPMTRRPRA